MQRFCALGILMIFIFALGCGEDVGAPTGAADAGMGDGATTEELCRTGTAGCFCRGTGTLGCIDEGFECIDNTCVQCTAGEEGCVCDESAACSSGLECVNPEPDCSFDCAPSICQSAQAQECGPTALCERTINECETDLTQQACEAFYADEANCRDMPAYTECNCACIERDSCAAYLACGNLCFNDNCN